MTVGVGFIGIITGQGMLVPRVRWSVVLANPDPDLPAAVLPDGFNEKSGCALTDRLLLWNADNCDFGYEHKNKRQQEEVVLL